jgi:hypothetical protein
MIRQIAVAALIVMTAACHKVDRCESLERLKSADPISDAKAAIARGDRRLLMLGGYVGTVPSADGRSRPTVMLGGTGDDQTPACYSLRPVAEAYARRYNSEIVGKGDH